MFKLKRKIICLSLLLTFIFANSCQAYSTFMYSYKRNYQLCSVYYETTTYSYWQNCSFDSESWYKDNSWKYKKNSRGEAYEYDYDSQKYERRPEND